MQLIRSLLSTCAMLVASLVVACSPSSSSSANEQAALVSFATDVIPIFKQSCAISVCHGRANNTAVESLYLGEPTNDTPDVVAQVYAGLVGIPALENPSMNLITASSTADSYLFFKLQGQQDTLEALCAKAATPCPDCAAPTTCGASMPFGGSIFSQESPAQFATIENWIAQGAKNN
jgi:hypothetical protein